MVILTHSTDFRKLRPFRWLRYVMYLDPNNIGQVMISSYMFPSWGVKMVKRYMSNSCPPINSAIYRSASGPRHRFIAFQPTCLWPQTTAGIAKPRPSSHPLSRYIHACWVYHSLHKIPFWIKVISLYDRLTKCMLGSCGSEFDDGKILSEDWAQACGNGRRCSTPFPHLTWTNWLMSRNFRKA